MSYSGPTHLQNEDTVEVVRTNNGTLVVKDLTRVSHPRIGIVVEFKDGFFAIPDNHNIPNHHTADRHSAISYLERTKA